MFDISDLDSYFDVEKTLKQKYSIVLKNTLKILLSETYMNFIIPCKQE